MDLQLVIEQGLFDLLRRIAGDYDLDYNDLCERYMSAPGPEPTVPVVRKVSSGSTCKGKTAKGLSCKKKSVDGCDGYCKTHAPKGDAESDGETSGPVMCKGKTAKGSACKKKASDGCDGYCKTHAPKEEEVLESESEVEVDICKGMTGKKQPCKKKAADGCDGYCKTHKGTGPFRLEPVHSHAPGDVDEECDACSSYGDPVNSPVSKREFTIVRRSERLMKQAEIVEDEEDEEDMLEFAKALQEQMEAEGILDE
jgi:hypothetical protein